VLAVEEAKAASAAMTASEVFFIEIEAPAGRRGDPPL